MYISYILWYASKLTFRLSLHLHLKYNFNFILILNLIEITNLLIACIHLEVLLYNCLSTRNTEEPTLRLYILQLP